MSCQRSLLTPPQLDCIDDVVEVDEHVVLSRTGQWLFLLKDNSELPADKQQQRQQQQQQEQQQQCFGYWFMLDAEAAAMEEEMKRVVNGAQALQVASRTQHLSSLLPLMRIPFPFHLFTAFPFHLPPCNAC